MSPVSTVFSAFCPADTASNVGYKVEACISVHVAPELAGACPVCLALYGHMGLVLLSISSHSQF